jgi:hypothetical protein
MHTDDLEKRLRDKERELQSGLAELESEARASGEAEVRDTTDDATSAEETSESFEEGAMVSETLEQVRDALRRLKTAAMTPALCVDARLNRRAWRRFLGRHTAWKINRNRRASSLLKPQSQRAPRRLP